MAYRYSPLGPVQLPLLVHGGGIKLIFLHQFLVYNLTQPYLSVKPLRDTRPPIPSPCTVQAPNDSENLPLAAATGRPSKGASTHPGRVSISTINPKEFRPVDGWPDKKPCIVCGRKPTHYQERTKGKKRPVTLCKSCYHRAVTMQSSQFRTIPGIIDVTRLQKWTDKRVSCL